MASIAEVADRDVAVLHREQTIQRVVSLRHREAGRMQERGDVAEGVVAVGHRMGAEALTNEPRQRVVGPRGGDRLLRSVERASGRQTVEAIVLPRLAEGA